MSLPKPKIDREFAMDLWISDRSEYAKEQVALNNQGLVRLMIGSLGLDMFDEDLFSIGLVGLVKAINTFDPQKGVKFDTYATTLIRNEILVSCRKSEPIKISINGRIAIDDESEVDMEISDGVNYEDEAIANNNRRQLFLMLSEKEKDIVLLKISGISETKIAKMYKTSQPTISRILKRIGKIYQNLICAE